MRIGIDIDGVILDTENVFRVKAELYDLLTLHKNGQINTTFWAQTRYDWNEEEVKNYRLQYLREASREAELKPGAKEVLDLLAKEHTLVIITARGNPEDKDTYEEMRRIVEEKFDKVGISFAKYYWGIKNKLEIVKKENINVMIDDRADICKTMAENGIKTLYFRDVNREKVEETNLLKEVNHWGEVYRRIYEWKMEEENAR